MQACIRIRGLSVDDAFRHSKDINLGTALGAFRDPSAAQSRAAWSDALWLCRLSASTARVASLSYLAAISSIVLRASGSRILLAMVRA
jgi:hypothetical protein